jgi:hypothetical protein
MKEIEEIFKNATFTDESHKARLRAQLFSENIVAYNTYGGGKMSDEKKLQDANLANELSDDDLDNAAGGLAFGVIAGDLVMRSKTPVLAQDAVFRPEQLNQNTLSGGPQRRPNDTTIC